MSGKKVNATPTPAPNRTERCAWLHRLDRNSSTSRRRHATSHRTAGNQKTAIAGTSIRSSAAAPARTRTPTMTPAHGRASAADDTPHSWTVRSDATNGTAAAAAVDGGAAGAQATTIDGHPGPLVWRHGLAADGRR